MPRHAPMLVVSVSERGVTSRQYLSQPPAFPLPSPFCFFDLDVAVIDR